MRLRIFDLNTPWFWLVIFYQRNYGKPWLEVSLWSPHDWQKWWLHFWQREKLPDERGGYVAGAAVTREREAEAVGTVQCGQADPVES